MFEGRSSLGVGDGRDFFIKRLTLLALNPAPAAERRRPGVTLSSEEFNKLSGHAMLPPGSVEVSSGSPPLPSASHSTGAPVSATSVAAPRGTSNSLLQHDLPGDGRRPHLREGARRPLASTQLGRIAARGSSAEAPVVILASPPP